MEEWAFEDGIPKAKGIGLGHRLVTPMRRGEHTVTDTPGVLVEDHESGELHTVPIIPRRTLCFEVGCWLRLGATVLLSYLECLGNGMLSQRDSNRLVLDGKIFGQWNSAQLNKGVAFFLDWDAYQAVIQ